MLAEVTNILNYKRHHYSVLDSTNEQAKLLIDESGNNSTLIDNNVITADIQTNGRGRADRSWVSDEGNLFFSVIIDIKSLANPEIYSHLAAWSLMMVIQKYGFDCQVKWPNDVLLKGKKFSGILLERVGSDFLVIGIGVNILSYPENTDNLSAISLNQMFDSEVSKDEILVKFLAQFRDARERLESSKLSSIMTDINNNLYAKNRKIYVSKTNNDKIEGTILNITDSGKLRLDIGNNNIVDLDYGEIFNM